MSDLKIDYEAEPQQRISPGMTWIDGVLYFGMVMTVSDDESTDAQGLTFITSEKQHFIATEAELAERNLTLDKGILVMPRRWSASDISDFLATDEEVDLAALLSRTLIQLEEYLEFENDDAYLMLALWTIGTYIHQVLDVYPYISLSGPKNAGKSKTLAVLKCLCFNGLLTADTSAAAMYRTIRELQPTFLIDEMNTLSDPPLSKETKHLLNLGYRKSRTVTRVDRSKGSRVIRQYSVYCPRVFVMHEGLEEVRDDYYIPLALISAAKTARARRKVKPNNLEWEELRNLMYRFALTYCTRVHQLYLDVDASAFSVYEAELWEPILALAKLFDVEKPVTQYALLLSKTKETDD